MTTRTNPERPTEQPDGGRPSVDVTVDQAIGMLMISYGIDERAASDLIDSWSEKYLISRWTLATTLVHLGARARAVTATGVGVPAPRDGSVSAR